jgi:hypothetical protein
VPATRNQADATFCDECATPLEATCPSCLASNRRAPGFCRLCGYPILSVRPSARCSRPGRRRRGWPSVARDRPRKRRLEGERKQLTVLFADIKGSMELIAFPTRRTPAGSSTRWSRR